MNEPLADTDWFMSGLVPLAKTRQQALATIGLFQMMRDTIGEPLDWWQECAALTPANWDRIQTRDFPDRGDAVIRGLKPIAMDPRKRAHALLSLDTYVAYLRGAFDIPETESPDGSH